MKCEEITISRGNIQEIFKKISQCLKANPDTHIFVSENIINVLKKDGKNYHIYMHNYICKYSSKLPNILHFSLHKDISFSDVISSMSCIKFSMDYYMIVIYRGYKIPKEYRYDEVNLKNCFIFNLSK